jgi:hypothetical protein
MKSFVMAMSLVVVLILSSSVLAQGYVTFMPVGPAPVAAYYAPAPVVSYGPVVSTSYYAPAPYYAAAPLPYYAASPVVTPYYVARPVAVAPLYGPTVIVRPKVYVVGQPVRNVLRAVTP